MPLWSAVDNYQHLSVRRKAWNTPSLATDWNQRFDQNQQWMSVTFMTWQSVWQQGRGKVTQFNRNSIQPNQPLQNPANATIWLVLWSQPIWFNRRLVRCFVSDIHDMTKCLTVCCKKRKDDNAWFISTLLNLWSVFPLDNSPTLLWSQPPESF